MVTESPSRLRVLLVEDNASNQKVMAAYLDFLGHDYALAGTAAEALDALAGGPFDAVLSDIQLPDISGHELIAAIRSTIEPIPFLVAVTAMARSDGELHYRELGFDRYLPKPVFRESLENVLGGIGT